MKKDDIIRLINTNRPCIEAAMREADLKAYLNTNFKYTLYLLPDGNIETRERLASDDWGMIEDPTACEISCYCYQYYDPLDADMDLPHLIGVLVLSMKNEEKTAYKDWLISYKAEYGQYPDDYERRDWIIENTEAYKSAYQWYVTHLAAETDYGEQLDSLIDDLYMWEEDEDASTT